MIERMKILILVVIFVLASDFSFADTFVYYSGKGKFNVKTQKLLNGEYAEFSSISKALFPNSKYDDKQWAVKTTNLKIKSSPGSFFIMCQIGEDVKVQQMNLPAILNNGDLMVPLEAFINVVHNLGIYNIDITQSGIFIENIAIDSEDTKEVKSKEETKHSEDALKKTNPKDEEVLEYEVNDNIELKKDESVIAKPKETKSAKHNASDNILILDTNQIGSGKTDKFSIPEELIRKDLEKILSPKK